MQTINFSKRVILTKNNEKYWLSEYNQYTGAIDTKKIFFDADKNNKAYHIKFQSTGEKEYHNFTKDEIEVSFAVVNSFEK